MKTAHQHGQRAKTRIQNSIFYSIRISTNLSAHIKSISSLQALNMKRMAACMCKLFSNPPLANGSKSWLKQIEFSWCDRHSSNMDLLDYDHWISFSTVEMYKSQLGFVS